MFSAAVLSRLTKNPLRRTDTFPRIGKDVPTIIESLVYDYSILYIKYIPINVWIEISTLQCNLVQGKLYSEILLNNVVSIYIYIYYYHSRDCFSGAAQYHKPNLSSSYIGSLKTLVGREQRNSLVFILSLIITIYTTSSVYYS